MIFFFWYAFIFRWMHFMSLCMYFIPHQFESHLQVLYESLYKLKYYTLEYQTEFNGFALLVHSLSLYKVCTCTFKIWTCLIWRMKFKFVRKKIYKWWAFQVKKIKNDIFSMIFTNYILCYINHIFLYSWNARNICYFLWMSVNLIERIIIINAWSILRPSLFNHKLVNFSEENSSS